MRCDLYTVQIGILRDPFHLRDSANVLRIGPDDIDRLLLDQILEVLPEIDFLSRMNGDRSGYRNFTKEFRIRIGCCSRP